MLYKRYEGEFASTGGKLYRAEIWQTAIGPFAVTELAFPAREPLMLEWKKIDKHEVICSSTATITLLSPSDRTYADLYTDVVASTRLDVYRDNVLYWRGTLDTEFYEEPYEQVENYPVTLTFSDFGALCRIPYALTGLRTIAEIMTYALQHIALAAVWTEIISTYLSATKITLASLSVDSANFYDEDGVAMDLSQVLSGILQPLALRIVQRAGSIYVYDINALMALSATSLRWRGDSSTMSTDKVFNDVVVTWNPYVVSGSISPSECWTQDIDREIYNLTEIPLQYSSTASYISFHSVPDDWSDSTESGFTIWLSTVGKNLFINNSGARFFKIVSQLDGSDTEGVAISWCGARYTRTETPISGGTTVTTSYNQQSYGIGFLGIARTDSGGLAIGTLHSSIFKTAPISVPIADSEIAQSLYLRLTIPLLFDPRFNPFEQAVDYNGNYDILAQKRIFNRCKAKANYFYVPVKVCFVAADGTVLYWTNKHVLETTIPVIAPTLSALSCGVWQAEETYGYVCYYNAKDRAEDCGLLGWHSNRHAIHPYHVNVASVIENVADGQYMPFPPSAGGTITVDVLTGWIACDAGSTIEVGNAGHWDVWYGNNWKLMQLPAFDIVNNKRFDNALDSDNVEYRALINSAAKETLSIDTICGTKCTGVPLARGAYISPAKQQIKTLTRAGVTGTAEELLIATIYSQYGARSTVLSGEIDISDALTAKETSQEERIFLTASDVQDLQDDSSEISLVEIKSDDYEKEV